MKDPGFPLLMNPDSEEGLLNQDTGMKVCGTRFRVHTENIWKLNEDGLNGEEIV